MIRKLSLALILMFAFAAQSVQAQDEDGWKSLFNGENLDGWTVKITKHPLGVDPFDTFRVEDGILKVSYDKYSNFDGQFGHLYSNLAYSDYILRMEYRFDGKLAAGASADLNSGVMIHSQPPQSMELDQRFPVSLEFQFLADQGKGPRSTGNVCTPGTNIEIDGNLVEQHIVKSSAPTFPADEWVLAEVEVHGSDEVIHRINGKEVMRYQHPQLDPKGASVKTEALFAAGAPLMLGFGHLALQSEGHPVWFRNIEIKPIEKK
jgi:hypothetical protein